MNLAEKLQIPQELTPMYDYFSFIMKGPILFLGAMRSFSQNEGYSVDYHNCEFSNEMHPLEEDYFEDGIRFSIDISHAYESEVIVSLDTFYKYLSRACTFYLEIHPDDSEEIKKLLEKIRLNLNINETN
ncbi:ribonuclease toxin immunity protein CdiI [Planomicrobium sp. MB-3u-38]|uniref:ribonuclease toxin immunity protein CdiI n=1 Tax=Planomicrobium sp. MB-3u-38 TaxID=2058318 RepID=UPI000C7AD20C|nr:ribonuclease toxin immunity protein CdiI [Planomicrobium sp. MB-3u-38]PKH09740.1 hypothetical protein CXF70_13255 [Planomicrobium sp. MB-3u-38]